MAKQVQVQNLFQYPVKSLAGVATQSLTVDGEGRALGDRVLAFRFNDSGPAMRQTSQGGWWYKDRLLSLMHIPACLLYTSPSPRDGLLSRMPSSA